MSNKALLIGINYIGTRSKLNGCHKDIENVFSYLKDRFQVVNEVKLVSSSPASSLERDLSISGTDEKDMYSIVQHLRLKFENDKQGADTHSVTSLSAKEYKKLTNIDMAHATVEVLQLRDDQEGAHRPTRENILKGFAWLVADATSDSHLFLHYSGHGSHQKDLNGDEENGGDDESICPVDYDTAGMIIDDDIRKLLVDPLPAECSLRCVFDCCHSGTVRVKIYS